MKVNKKLCVFVGIFSFLYFTFQITFPKNKIEHGINNTSKDKKVLIQSEEKTLDVLVVEEKKLKVSTFNDYTKKFKDLDTHTLNLQIIDSEKRIKDSGLILVANAKGLSNTQERELRGLLRHDNALRSVRAERMLED